MPNSSSHGSTPRIWNPILSTPFANRSANSLPGPSAIDAGFGKSPRKSTVFGAFAIEWITFLFAGDLAAIISL